LGGGSGPPVVAPLHSSPCLLWPNGRPSQQLLSSCTNAHFVVWQERGGSSRHAILKYIVTHYKLGQDERAINAHLKLALRAGVKSGLLKQSKGSGAAGSFKLGEKAEKKATAKKPKAVKKPKAAGSPKKAKKPKKVAASGEAKPKKAKAAKKAKSPAKAKVSKPKTAKKPKVAKSPKKPKTTKAAKPKAAKPKKAKK